MLLLGLFMVFSASFATVGTKYFLAQAKWVAAGSAVCSLRRTDSVRSWRKWAIPVMAFTVLILIAVLIFGARCEFGGKRTFTGARFQPSELAKLGVTIYVAACRCARGRRVGTFKEGFIPFAVIIGLVAGLIILDRASASP